MPDELLASYGEDPQHFEHVLAELHSPAVALAGYEVIPPAVANSAVIQGEIIRNLELADLVVCDISTLNSNVFFELGIRVALDRPVAMIKDDRTTKIPFDTGIVSCHTYDPRLAPWVLRSEVPQLAEWIRKAGERKDNAMWKYFGITRRAEASAPSDPVQAKLDVLLAEVAAARRWQRDQTDGTVLGEVGAVEVKFEEAVDLLLERCGLKKRRGAFRSTVEPDIRGLALEFDTPPSDFVLGILRDEAERLKVNVRVRSRGDSHPPRGRGTGSSPRRPEKRR